MINFISVLQVVMIGLGVELIAANGIGQNKLINFIGFIVGIVMLVVALDWRYL